MIRDFGYFQNGLPPPAQGVGQCGDLGCYMACLNEQMYPVAKRKCHDYHYPQAPLQRLKKMGGGVCASPLPFLTPFGLAKWGTVGLSEFFSEPPPTMGKMDMDSPPKTCVGGDQNWM